MSMFNKQHYNAIAKEFRENWPLGYKRGENLIVSNALTNLAISMAVRFKKDNSRFDPVKFLNACSPHPDTMPLGELWDDYFLLDPEDRL